MKLTDADIQTLLAALTYYADTAPAGDEGADELADRLRKVITVGTNAHYVS